MLACARLCACWQMCARSLCSNSRRTAARQEPERKQTAQLVLGVQADADGLSEVSETMIPFGPYGMRIPPLEAKRKRQRKH